MADQMRWDLLHAGGAKHSYVSLLVPGFRIMCLASPAVPPVTRKSRVFVCHLATLPDA